MKQKTFFNRTFVILIGLIICISLILCFYVCDQQVNAETAIWEKIDYEEISFKEDSTNFSLYLIVFIFYMCKCTVYVCVCACVCVCVCVCVSVCVCR